MNFKYLVALTMVTLLQQGCGPDEFYVDDENIPDKYKINLPSGGRQKAEKVETSGYGDGELDESPVVISDYETEYYSFFEGCEQAYPLSENSMIVKFDSYYEDVVVRQTDEDRKHVYKRHEEHVGGYAIFEDLKADVSYEYSCILEDEESYDEDYDFDWAPNQVWQVIDTELFGEKFDNPCFHSEVESSYYSDAGDVKSIVIDFYHHGKGQRPSLYKNGVLFYGKGVSDYEHIDQYVDYSYEEGDSYYCYTPRLYSEPVGTGMVHPYQVESRGYDKTTEVQKTEY